MGYDKLACNRGRLSQVTSAYKLFINNHSVTFKRNPLPLYRYTAIRLIVAKGSLKILAFHSLPKNQTQKIQKSWNKKCDN